MIPVLLLIAQAAADTPPDIALSATVRARSMTIEKKGDASLVVWSDPPGRNIVDVRAPAADGRKTVRNPVIQVDFEARIAGPDSGAEPPN